ncbi:MAG: transcriptional regulator [Ardenticatenaceae bacterium]|nr:transcriptional regulator [Ardenticatenaceae bacterium]
MLQPQVAETLTQSAEFIFVPTSEAEYSRLVELLDEITDIVRDDETHPLAKMMDVIGVLVEDYEDEHVPEPEGDPISVLKFLMEEHELKQVDLSELGSQGVVSEILNGKRDLNLRQVRALSERFKVPASVFI